MTKDVSKAEKRRQTLKTKDKKKSGTKLTKKHWFIIGGLIFAGLIYVGTRPFQGTVRFGICKVFAEQTTRYPDNIDYVLAEEGPTFVRMEYTTMNPFGQTTHNVMLCSFEDLQNPRNLTEVEINRVPVSADKVKLFNVGIPAILKTPPSLVLPLLPSGELVDLKREKEAKE